MTREEKRQNNKPSKKMMIRNNLFERGNEARIVRRIVSVIALLIIIVGGGTIIGGYKYVSSALSPLDPDNNKLTPVEIPIGSSTTTIGNILEENGIIKNGTIFKYYVKFNNISGFQAGNYQLSPSMTLEEISATLQTGKLVREPIFRMTIPEGLRLDQIATIIAKNTDYTEEEIIETFDDPDLIENLMKKYPDILSEEITNSDVIHPLEGYLFPATYPFYEDNPSLESIIDTLIKQTQTVVTPYIAILAEKEMTVHELLTLASLIEKEAPTTEDRLKISSVFYNRMEIDMPLQTDPTVAYALGTHLDRTLYEHLEVDSPYNTYKVAGLPPGPIANAGVSSIEAALNPAETDFLYFLAEYGTGTVHYSKTLKDHEELTQKYIIDKRNEAKQ